MSSAVAPATPQRPLAGAFPATPAAAPSQPQQSQNQGTTIFGPNAATLRQNQQPPTTNTQTQSTSPQTKSPIDRAAATINATFAREAQFPALEDYVQQGISGEYEQPKLGSALEPFQKLKLHDLPPRLLEQANNGQMAMQMGVFAPLGHAWVALDNCLYLWDYSLPNPEILGFEENTHPITAVKLVPPKPGVFVEDIKHMIVVCTDVNMLLLGVAMQTTPTGAREVHMYNTQMTISTRGLGVDLVEATRNGRIFFCGSQSEDIYEFQYQQEDGWFRGKTARVCHTKNGIGLLPSTASFGSFMGSAAPRKTFNRIAIDDSRGLMYTLTTASDIKIWLIKDNTLEPNITRPLNALMQNAGHFANSNSELLRGRDVAIVAISALPAAEAKKVSIMATTNTGCRLYLSVTRGYGYDASVSNPPSSMQVLHVRFPPRDPAAPPPQGQQSQALAPISQSSNQTDTSSTYLMPTHIAYRFSPGSWLAFTSNPADPSKHRVFCIAPDSARLKNPQGMSQINNYVEYGQWIDLPSIVSQVQELTPPFVAAPEPLGFGNELAVQFDKPSAEYAIVTTTGIQTIRRKRLVDIFAGMMRYGASSDEGLEADVKRFVRTYGRAETCATALAVACGKGVDVADNRVASISDPETLEKARKVFVEHGGSPDFNANSVVDAGSNPIESVTASPRHEGIALYMSRLIRSIWRAKIITSSSAGLMPTIKIDKLREVQRDLTTLNEFLTRNKSFIEGLAGPQSLSRAKTRQEEIALQGEHQHMNSLVRLLEKISEGISFVIVLFDERVEDILALLPEDSKNKSLEMTFENLFVADSGHDLGKELVRAIVNRNIANGSNVDTVAETLRRRCGSFCSDADVVIFKAQEQVKRAMEQGAHSEYGRQLLNESQRLFQKCAASLPYDYLRQAVEDYVGMSFYAGAVQLCLTVANEKDKAKRALSWLREGKPQSDSREAAYNERLLCYRLIQSVIRALDAATANAPGIVDGQYTIATKRRNEAYDVINKSDDIVFMTELYDWYVGSGPDDLNQPDRLLGIDSPYVVEYLRKRSQDHRLHNDLLWRYFAHHNDFLQAAGVQLDLARSHFDELTLSERIEYLSRARTNASTRTTVITDSRQSKQRLLREVTDLVEIAEVQQELLERLKADDRIQASQKANIAHDLNGEIHGVDFLFNKYADAAKYHDICILLYKVADHRNPGDIRTSWEQLIKDTSTESIALYGQQMKPWEAVGGEVRRLGRRLGVNPSTFPVNTLLPLLEAYAYEPRAQHPPDEWAIDIFLDLDIPCETLLPVLESMFYGNMQPFTGGRKKKLAEKMVYVIQRWFAESEKSGERVLFGSEENLSLVQDCLGSLGRDTGLGQEVRDAVGLIGGQISQALR